VDRDRDAQPQARSVSLEETTAPSLDVGSKGGTVTSEISNESLEEARRYVRRKRIFYAVLGVWIALCVMWFVIDMTDDSSSIWFYWPMLGTGIAVAITGAVLLGIGGLMGADWERREIDKYLGRRGNVPDR
jgi:hypothetical protein